MYSGWGRSLVQSPWKPANESERSQTTGLIWLSNASSKVCRVIILWRELHLGVHHSSVHTSQDTGTVEVSTNRYKNFVTCVNIIQPLKRRVYHLL